MYNLNVTFWTQVTKEIKKYRTINVWDTDILLSVLKEVNILNEIKKELSSYYETTLTGVQLQPIHL